MPIPGISTPPDKTQRWISFALSTLRLNFALCRWPQFRQDAFIRAESRGREGGIHVGSSHLQENRDRRLVAQQRRRGHSQRHRRGEQDAGERRVVRGGRDSRPCPGWPGGAFSGHGEDRLPPEEQLIPSHARTRRAEFIRLTGPPKAERVRLYGTAAAFGIAPHAFVWQQSSRTSPLRTRRAEFIRPTGPPACTRASVYLNPARISKARWRSAVS